MMNTLDILLLPYCTVALPMSGKFGLISSHINFISELVQRIFLGNVQPEFMETNKHKDTKISSCSISVAQFDFARRRNETILIKREMEKSWLGYFKIKNYVWSKVGFNETRNSIFHNIMIFLIFSFPEVKKRKIKKVRYDNEK